jgi:hypothetical protein
LACRSSTANTIVREAIATPDNTNLALPIATSSAREEPPAQAANSVQRGDQR